LAAVVFGALEPELAERIVAPTPDLTIEIERAYVAAARRDLRHDRDLADRLRSIIGPRIEAHRLPDLAPLPDAALMIERIAVVAARGDLHDLRQPVRLGRQVDALTGAIGQPPAAVAQRLVVLAAALAVADLSAAVGTPAAHLAGPQPAIAGELIDAGERGDLDRHPLRVPALAVAELTGTPAPRGLAIEREGAALPEVEVELRGSQIDELGRSIAADQIADAELPLIVVAPAVDRARLRQRAGKVVVGLDL